MEQLQKANMWKRISAALCDFILLTIAVTGFALLLSLLLGVDGYAERMDQFYAQYEQEYGLKENTLGKISLEDFEKLPEAEKAAMDAAIKAINADKEVVSTNAMLFQLILIVVVFSPLLSYLLLEFLVPLLFKNGQTVGKKIFGIAVMREDSVKITAPLLFARSILGKCTVETLLPIFVFVLIFMGQMGILGIVMIVVLAVTELALLLFTRGRTPIHDMLAHTVTVDIVSQRIFDSPAALLAYKQQIHQEAVEKADY